MPELPQAAKETSSIGEVRVPGVRERLRARALEASRAGTAQTQEVECVLAAIPSRAAASRHVSFRWRPCRSRAAAAQSALGAQGLMAGVRFRGEWCQSHSTQLRDFTDGLVHRRKQRLRRWPSILLALVYAATASAGWQQDWNETGPPFAAGVHDSLHLAGAADGSALIGFSAGDEYRLSRVRGDASIAVESGLEAVARFDNIPRDCIGRVPGSCCSDRLDRPSDCRDTGR